MTAARAAAAFFFRKPSKRRGSLLFPLSACFTDIILLAQLLGAVANIIWFLEINTSDLVGFIYVGGDAAGLLAYFGFMLFGALFFVVAPRRFWRSLHPVTFGLALLLLASHRLWKSDFSLIAFSACVGAAGGGLLYRFALLYPRLAFAALAVMIMLGRYFMPRAVAPYGIVLLGALLMGLVALPAMQRALHCRWHARGVRGARR